MTKRCLCPAALCFLFGIIFSVYGIWWGIPLAAVLFVYVFLRFRRFGKTIQGLIIAGILAVSFFSGIFTGTHNNDTRNAYLNVLKNGQKITVQGRLYKTETKNFRINMYLDRGYVLLDTGPVPCRDIVIHPETDGFIAGNTLVVTGTYEEFSTARNEGNYDEREYNYSRGIDIEVSHILDIKEYGRTRTVRGTLARIQEKMKTVIGNAMSESAAGTLTAMVLGDKTSLLAEDKSLYAEAGFSHILSVSGLHVSLLCMGLFGILRKIKIPVLPSVTAASVFAVTYCIFTGENTATIRAVGMFLISMAAMALGEAYDMLSALSVLAVIIAVDNPQVISSAGFLLSFGAVIGIAVTGQKLTELYKQLASRRKFVRDMKRKLEEDERRALGRKPGMIEKSLRSIKDRAVKAFEDVVPTVLMNLGIVLTTLPVVIWFYFEVPTLSLILNLIIIPLMGILLCLGFMGALAGCLFYPLGAVLLKPCEMILAFCRGMARASSAIPFSAWVVGRMSPVGVAVYYVVLAGFIAALSYAAHRCSNRQVQEGHPAIYVAVVMAAAVLLSALPAFFVPPCPRIAVLDVDQGDGIFICTKDGTHIFVDGGSTGVKSVGRYRIQPFLKYHGIGHIDYWFVSHADEDHVNGMEEMIEDGYRVCNLVLSNEIPDDDNSQMLFEAAHKSGAKVFSMRAGDRLVCGEDTLTCVFPADGYKATDANAGSLVLLYENPDFRMLLTGDMGKDEERALMKRWPSIRGGQKPLVLKVAHHGSKNSSDESFLETIAPDYAVISAGIDNSYGHPHKDTLEKIKNLKCPYFRTDEDKELIIDCKDGKVNIYSFDNTSRALPSSIGE